jgi:AcrR family transcriptional regulator
VFACGIKLGVDSKIKPENRIIKRRLRGDARREAIVAEATRMFADSGFEVSTRDIAGRCDITQAALYKHFSSKDDIVQAVFRNSFLDRDTGYFADVLADRGQSLEARIASAYQMFFQRVERVRQRLFLRAAMEGYPLPKEFSPTLDHGMLEPLAEQLRIDGGLPPLDTEPMQHAERELVLLLHSAIVFLALRRNIYNIDLDAEAPWIIAQDVRVWLTGARQRLQEIWAT